jgi:hypothetical protein
LNRADIVRNIEKRLSSYDNFEDRIVDHLTDNYFAFVYQSFYNKMGYKKKEKLFSTNDYKHFIHINNFLDLVNEIYRTRLSRIGLKIISERLQKVEDFEVYKNAINIFEHCNPVTDKHGNTKIKNAFSFGTKILHFYDPEKNPILDSNVRNNIGIKEEMSKELCIEFREAAISFTDNYKDDYFEKFNTSVKLKQKLNERFMITNFSTMEILDMALYEKLKINSK